MRGQKKLQRPAAKTQPNTIDTRPPREFICLIGAPSNCFNGWVISGFLRNGVRPDETKRWIHIAKAKPANMQETIAYFREAPRIPPGVPQVGSWVPGQDKAAWTALWRNAVSDDDWRAHGYAKEALDTLVERGWSPFDVFYTDQVPSTHDLFWGNFALPAMKLYGSTGPLDAGGGETSPSQPRPKQGDVVTFIVAYGGYEHRDDVDFAASPYNLENRDPLDDSKYLGDPPQRRAPRQRSIAAPVREADYGKLSLAEKAKLLAEEAAKHGKTITIDRAREYLIAEGESDGA